MRKEISFTDLSPEEQDRVLEIWGAIAAAVAYANAATGADVEVSPPIIVRERNDDP